MRTDVVELVADPYPPYQYEEGGTIRGVDHDVVAAAFREHGLRTTTKLLPWDQCLDSVRTGEAHGVFQIQRTPERDALFTFSALLRKARTVFFTRREKAFRFVQGATLAQALSRFRLGIVRGYDYGPMILELPASAKAVVDTHEALLQGLSDARFDVAIADLGVASYLCNKMGITNLTRVEGYEVSRGLHVAFRKELTELADVFNSGLDRIRSKGLTDTIFAQYAVTECWPGQ